MNPLKSKFSCICITLTRYVVQEEKANILNIY